MRSFVALIAVAACTRADRNDRDLAAALDCAVHQVVEGARGDLDLVPTLTDTLRIAAPRPVALRVLRRLAHELPNTLDLAHTAFALAEQGDLSAARDASVAALAAGDQEKDPATRDDATEHAALVIAWAGDPARAEKLAGTNAMAWLAVAQGAARAGNKAAGDHALAAMPAGADNQGMLRAMRIDALAWLGRVADAQQEIAGETDPAIHFYDSTQLAHNAMLARLPEATALLRAAVVEAGRFSYDRGPDRVNWLAHRTQLAVDLEAHGDHADAAALRAAIVADLAPDEITAVDDLAVAAELADAPREADALVARAGTSVLPDTRAAIAAMRGDFKTAIGLVPQLAPDGLVLVWARLAAATPDPGIIAAFRAAVCQR